MLTAMDVQEIARTGQSHVGPNGTLTVEDVVRMTSTADWEGALYQLHLGPASQIAAQWNTAHSAPRTPLSPAGKTRGRRKPPRALAGEVLPAPS